MSTLNHTGFRAQLFTELDQRIADKDQVLRMFSEDKGRAMRLYRAYMRERGGAQREDIYATVDQRVLGDERFVEKVMAKQGEGN